MATSTTTSTLSDVFRQAYETWDEVIVRRLRNQGIDPQGKIIALRVTDPHRHGTWLGLGYRGRCVQIQIEDAPDEIIAWRHDVPRVVEHFARFIVATDTPCEACWGTGMHYFPAEDERGAKVDLVGCERCGGMYEYAAVRGWYDAAAKAIRDATRDRADKSRKA